MAELTLKWLLPCVHSVVRLQLVFEAEPLAAAVALVRLLSSVDAFMAPKCAIISETAPTELTLKGMVTCV